MINEFSIFKEDYVAGGYLIATKEGRNDYATLMYLDIGNDRWVVDETYIGGDLRGTGAERVLAEEIVSEARAAGVQLIPFCKTFLSTALDRPDWHDSVSVPAHFAHESRLS